MFRICLIPALLIVSVVLGMPRPVQAQLRSSTRPYAGRSYSARSGTYQPARQTFSPYLQLSRQDRGQLLPSYQNFVQPLVQERQFRDQQVTRTQFLQQGLQQIEQTQRQLQDQRQGGIPTGIGSGFRNNEQYYRNSVPFFRTHRPR